jgi:histidinol-phosphatase (PHP family)
MLSEMRQRNIPVTLGADAHEPNRVSDGYEQALRILTECGYDQVCFFLERRRNDVLISDALESLVARSNSI